jgi:hypothetical protein
MKKQIKIKFKFIFLMSIFLGISYLSTAQNGNPPPPNGGDGGEHNSVVGGGAPIGGGSFILLLLASAYGTAKYRTRRSLADAKSKNQHRNKQKGKHYISPSLKTFLLIAGLFLFSFNTQKVLADTFTVTTLNDAGNGALRWAIEQVNATAGQHTINFDLNGTITLVTALPAITRDYTIIDASSQWQGVWPNGSPGIEINGTNLPITSVGIYLNGASHCEIRGLHINNFSADDCKAILTFNSAGNNIIGGTGTGMRNVITNSYTGIELRSNSNTVIGNYIGVASDGLTAAPNIQRGVYINQSNNNTIGGTNEAERNVISGNTYNGITIDGQYTSVKGNYIGLKKSGTAALANGSNGITIMRGNNTIGGTQAGDRNIISGNGEQGIDIWGATTSGNVITGNYIGTDANGTSSLGNTENGILLRYPVNNNTIGGEVAGAGNVISGNGWDGIALDGANNNDILGNLIGTDKNGTAARGNDRIGVYFANGATGNTIGGNTPGARNIISANGWGLAILGCNNNTIKGNYIGTDINGTADLGNTNNGVLLYDGAQSNTIGGTAQGEGNLISGNNSSGVSIQDVNTKDNLVQGNYIGTDAGGTTALPNGIRGVYLHDGANNNTIGGTDAGARNVISGNTNEGVFITDVNTDYNLVQGNYIGTAADGIELVKNIIDGVLIYAGAQYNIIGGAASGAGNIISGNGGTGVKIQGSNTSYNKVQGNIIGLNLIGNFRRNYNYGVDIRDGANENTIGGDSETAGNVISSNRLGGVSTGYQTTGYANVNGTIIRNNLIGTTLNGLENASNQQYGVYLAHLSNGTLLKDNVIAASTSYGVFIKGGAHTITGNIIGSDRGKTLDLGNSNHGIYLDADGSTIGGTTAGDGNFIAYNKDGINIAKSDITLYGNTICHNSSGVKIQGADGEAQNNIIGGTGAGQANVICNNTVHGVYVYGDYESGGYDYRLTDYHKISGNSIYDNGFLGIKLYESGNGPGTGPAITTPLLTTTQLNPNTEMLSVAGTGAGTGATVEVFVSDDGTSGEGKTYLGSLTADAAKASGDFSGTLDVSGKGLSAGDNIVATTIHTDNNTSQFSAVSIVTALNTAISAQNGNWHEGTTWIGGSVPAASDHAVVYEGHEVAVSGTQSCLKLSLKPNAILLVNDGLPAATAAYDFDVSSTVNYHNASKGVQTVSASPVYGQLVLSGSGNKTADGALQLTGNMQISGSAVFLSSQNLETGGHLTLMENGQFNPTGNANVNGNLSLTENSTAQNSGVLTVGGNLAMQNNAVLSLGNNLNVDGNLNIESSATLNGGSYTIGLAGNWINQGTWNPGSSTLHCNAAETDQNIGPAAGAGIQMQVGEGTSNGFFYPFNNVYYNNRSQMLYQGSDIGSSGTITSIQFQLQSASSGDYRNLNNFTVKMIETTDAHWDSQSDYVDMTGATIVFAENPYQMPDATGWFTIELQTPFTFDHSKNLIVEIVWGPIPIKTYSTYRVYYTSGSNNCVLYGYDNSQTPPNYDGKSANLPNIIFNISAGEGEAMAFYNLLVDKSNSDSKLTALADLQVDNNLDVHSGILVLESMVAVQGNTAVGTSSRGSAQIDVKPDHSLTVNGDLSLNNTGEIVLHDSDDPLTNPGMLLPKQAVTVDGNGKCTAQRYYQGNQWHLVSSPMADALSEIFIGKVLQYHTENDNSWNDITSVSHPLNPAQGYSLWASAAESVLAEFAGTPNSGNQTFDFVLSGGEGFGWNMVGNPYTATIDWDQVIIPENLDATIYLWDPAEGESGNYLYYLPDGPSNTTSQYVAMAQGFFVHCNNVAGGILNFTPAAMTTEPATFYKSEKQNENTLIYQVINHPSSKGSVRFMNDASDDFDPLLDAYRMTPGNGIPMVYTESENIKMAVNSLPNLSDSRSVDLGFSANVPGEYTLSFEGQDSFVDAPIYLKDKKANTLTDLTQQDNYSFVSEDGDDAARFTLLFGKSAGVPQNETDHYVSIFPNPSFGQVTVAGLEAGALLTLSNLNGQILIKDQISNTKKLQLDLSAYPAGVYFLNVQFNEVSIFHKLILR